LFVHCRNAYSFAKMKKPGSEPGFFIAQRRG